MKGDSATRVNGQKTLPESVERYVLVREDSEPEAKGSTIPSAPSDSVALYRAIRRGTAAMRGRTSRNKSGQEAEIYIAGSFSAVLTKNAATAASVSIDLASFADWTALASLYDEVTLVDGQVFWFADYTHTGQANTTTVVVAWDPIDSSSPVTGNDLLCYAHNSGPVACGWDQNGTSTPGIVVPHRVVSKNGFLSFRFRPFDLKYRDRIDRRPETQPANLSCSSAWLATNTASINVGWLKLYATAPGATTNGAFAAIVKVRIRLRSRNG